MSRYDELSLKYANFCAISEQTEKVASDLSNAVTSALSAPAGAVFSAPVAWADNKWLLASKETAIFRRHEDGRFYFAICIRFTADNGQHEPQILALLLSMRVGSADTEVRLEDTKPKFSAHLADPGARNDLVGEIIGVIEDTLDLDPNNEPPRLNIGLVEA